MRYLQRIPALSAILMAMTAMAGPASGEDWSDAATISVKLSNFRFEPSTITLEHGTRYTFHIVNTASGGHDFVARDFFAKAQIAPQDRDKVEGGEIEFGGGESVDVHLVAPAAGTYKVHCSHFMHSAFGMKGTIVVR